jgi:hypothetical protein
MKPLVLSAGCLLLAPALATLAAQAAPQPVEVRLNDRAIAPGVALRLANGQEQVFVSVLGLARSVDGPEPVTRSRLHVDGASLYAAITGGCDRCHVAVRRPVLISSGLRLIGLEPYLPLGDLVRAFEGRLEARPPPPGLQQI